MLPIVIYSRAAVADICIQSCMLNNLTTLFTTHIVGFRSSRHPRLSRYVHASTYSVTNLDRYCSSSVNETLRALVVVAAVDGSLPPVEFILYSAERK
jgi:hypothetical protein